MLKANYIRHYIHEKGIRLTTADVSSGIAEMLKIHRLPLLSSAIMGKILACTAVLATDFKNHEGISLLWKTNTTLGTIRSDMYDGKYIRGYMDGYDEGLSITSTNEKKLISGVGAQLTITRYSLLRQPYSSTIHVTSGTIAQCFEQYKKESDQILCRMQTSVIIRENEIISASAKMMELLPEGDIAFFRHLGEETLNEQKDSLENMGFMVLSESPIIFQCTCNNKRIMNSLMGLPNREKEKLLQQPCAEITCHSCGKIYKISNQVMKEWFM
ncbi:chaperonin HslO [Veillonellaceae bacterium DNF00626]|nr:chaperonin HslO [Veillonellaceae bacterium DNF00626]